MTSDKTVTGDGVRRADGRSFDYQVRFLTPADIPLLLDLHQVVIDSLPQPVVLYERDAKFFEKCTTDQGCVVGAIHEGRMISYAALYRPLPGEENYGEDLELPSEDLHEVGHLAGSAVHPEYRGNGLQAKLVDLRSDFARESGVRHLCGEVLPMNIISIANHLREGFLLKADKIDKIGLVCYVLHMRLDRDERTRAAADTVDRNARDHGVCCQAMRDGRWGFEVVRHGTEPHIRFGRFLTH
jgi:ribosomal protein S18 acetylase RimI-like enzyme